MQKLAKLFAFIILPIACMINLYRCDYQPAIIQAVLAFTIATQIMVYES